MGVLAARWDAQSASIVHRPAKVLSWSDTQVVVQLGSYAASGVVAFADVGFIAIYDQWARGENQRVAAAMHAAGCPGYSPAAHTVIWAPWSESPAFTPAAAYQAGAPRIVADLTLEPGGQGPERWSSNAAHLQTGKGFRIGWRTVNAEGAILRPGNAEATQILAAAGYPGQGVAGLTGSVVLAASPRPAIVEFRVEASNAVCGTVNAPFRIVVTGPALQPVKIVVLQALPGGDVDVTHSDIEGSGFTNEVLVPASGQSIPLVAQKRTVVRLDWWAAFPQVPPGEELTATATIELNGPAAPWPNTVTLWPASSTVLDSTAPLDPPVELRSGRPFMSLFELDQWIAQSVNNNPATFNVVIPTALCSGEVKLKATIRAWNRDFRVWTATETRFVKFHQRRQVRIRYRPWGWTVNLPANQAAIPAPTDQQCETAIRGAASLLPIPDPQIIRLPGPAYERGNNSQLVETLFAERMAQFNAEMAAGNNPEQHDEIWLVIGPAGVGGVASAERWPWTAATSANAITTAHEIGHMFHQRHIRLCGAAQDPEEPASFPDQGNVVATGWDMWNNRLVRGAIDLMTYCPNRWVSPERWRRIFLRAIP